MGNNYTTGAFDRFFYDLDGVTVGNPPCIGCYEA